MIIVKLIYDYPLIPFSICPVSQYEPHPDDFNLKIGGHANKLKTLLLTVQIQPYYLPMQIFLNGNTRVSVKANQDDICATMSYLTKNPREVFVHAPYSLNLCKPPNTEDNYFTKCTSDALDISCRAGFHGVVLHTGKIPNGSPNKISYMTTNVRSCLKHATIECPLLIETPAGQGSEQLTSPEDLVKFVTDINDRRLGICIDTCHVFSLGYDPADYWCRLHDMDALHLVKLVHYNDSAVPLGAHRDRHAPIGQGHISLQSLHKVAYWAIQLGIPLVRE